MIDLDAIQKRIDAACQGAERVQREVAKVRDQLKRVQDGLLDVLNVADGAP